MQLDKLGSVTASNRVVLRVHLRTGSRYEVPQHWRGATLDDFDGRALGRMHLGPAPASRRRRKGASSVTGAAAAAAAARSEEGRGRAFRRGRRRKIGAHGGADL